MGDALRPQFPLYTISKGRNEYMMTSKALTEMGCPHNIVVEPQEYDAYRAAVDEMQLAANVIVMDLAFKERYELLDTLGRKRSTGPGPARNFVWEHSVKQGHSWHWVMDDNIKCFRRMHNKQRIKCITPAFWRAMEDFVLRYKNVAMAGPNYSMFAFGASALPPFTINTRIYSCNLICNDLPYRWRGRYNEDTILSLDMLTGGWCTVQFNAFLQEKIGTQTIKGGCTSEFYHVEGKLGNGERYAKGGTDAKTLLLAAVYPEYTTVKWKFGRVHHQVNYSPFKKRKLIRNPGVEVQQGTNEYGMTQIRVAR